MVAIWAAKASSSPSWTRVKECADVPVIRRPYRRPASRSDVASKPAITAARALWTAATSWVRRAPNSTQGRPWAAAVIREAAVATAESWLRIERMTVSRTQASAKVPRTVRTGECGK